MAICALHKNARHSGLAPESLPLPSFSKIAGQARNDIKNANAPLPS